MAKKISIIMLLALCLWGVSVSTASASWFDWIAGGGSSSGGDNSGLVRCGNGTGTTGSPAATNCDFAAAVDMINRIIDYLIMISMPLAAISFAYAGWLYLSAGDNTGQVSKARTIFLDVGIGVIIILSGWLVFKLIATTFLNPNAGYGTYLN
jgi:hypothetical protein